MDVLINSSEKDISECFFIIKHFLKYVGFGESIILLDPDAEWSDKVKIKNDKFNQQNAVYSKAASKYYTDKPSGGFTGD